MAEEEIHEIRKPSPAVLRERVEPAAAVLFSIPGSDLARAAKKQPGEERENQRQLHRTRSVWCRWLDLSTLGS